MAAHRFAAVRRGSHSSAPLLWLDRFVSAVRNNDLAAGRDLFAPDVVGYGVISDRMLDLDALVDEQWRPTWRQVAAWSVTDVDLAVAAENVAVLAFCWRRENPDGSGLSGRATVILRLSADGWVCVHSHLSASP